MLLVAALAVSGCSSKSDSITHESLPAAPNLAKWCSGFATVKQGSPEINGGTFTVDQISDGLDQLANQLDDLGAVAPAAIAATTRLAARNAHAVAREFSRIDSSAEMESLQRRLGTGESLGQALGIAGYDSGASAMQSYASAEC